MKKSIIKYILSGVALYACILAALVAVETQVHGASSPKQTPLPPADFSYESEAGSRVDFRRDQTHFTVTMHATGFNDFSTRIEGMRKLGLTGIKTVEIIFPLSACRFNEENPAVHLCRAKEPARNGQKAIVRLYSSKADEPYTGKNFFTEEKLTVTQMKTLQAEGDTLHHNEWRHQTLISLRLLERGPETLSFDFKGDVKK